VIVPREIFGDGKAEVFGVVDNLKLLAMGVSSRARLFADDCLLYRPIKTEADATKLQEDIDALQNWESTWQMSFNPDKCEVLSITNKYNKIMANYYIHGQQLQIVDNAKYLGLTISKNRRQSSANSLALDETQGGMSLCKREKAGDQGQCLGGRQKSLYIVQSVYLRGLLPGSDWR
jgi:hypothetical protein